MYRFSSFRFQLFSIFRFFKYFDFSILRYFDIPIFLFFDFFSIKPYLKPYLVGKRCSKNRAEIEITCLLTENHFSQPLLNRFTCAFRFWMWRVEFYPVWKFQKNRLKNEFKNWKQARNIKTAFAQWFTVRFSIWFHFWTQLEEFYLRPKVQKNSIKK